VLNRHTFKLNPYVKSIAVERSMFPCRLAVNTGPTTAIPGIYCEVSYASLRDPLPCVWNVNLLGKPQRESRETGR
jgi:hypothetical protein